MNLLTQETEPDLEVLSELPTPGASKRGGNYHRDEDIQLCISWDAIANDPIGANEQSGKTFWTRIAEHYHEHKTFASDRSVLSLEKR